MPYGEPEDREEATLPKFEPPPFPLNFAGIPVDFCFSGG